MSVSQLSRDIRYFDVLLVHHRAKEREESEVYFFLFYDCASDNVIGLLMKK